MVNAVIVVSEFRKLTFGFVVRRQTGLDSDHLNFAYRIAERLSETTDIPAIPKAIVRSGA